MSCKVADGVVFVGLLGPDLGFPHLVKPILLTDIGVCMLQHGGEGAWMLSRPVSAGYWGLISCIANGGKSRQRKRLRCAVLKEQSISRCGGERAPVVGEGSRCSCCGGRFKVLP
jgi:hypothetical protein